MLMMTEAQPTPFKLLLQAPPHAGYAEFPAVIIPGQTSTTEVLRQNPEPNLPVVVLFCESCEREQNFRGKWVGTQPGVVTVVASPENKDGGLGQQISIQQVNSDGVWDSKIIHIRQSYVRHGQEVKPGEPIGVGSGDGEQFKVFAFLGPGRGPR